MLRIFTPSGLTKLEKLKHRLLHLQRKEFKSDETSLYSIELLRVILQVIEILEKNDMTLLNDNNNALNERFLRLEPPTQFATIWAFNPHSYEIVCVALETMQTTSLEADFGIAAEVLAKLIGSGKNAIPTLHAFFMLGREWFEFLRDNARQEELFLNLRAKFIREKSILLAKIHHDRIPANHISKLYCEFLNSVLKEIQSLRYCCITTETERHEFPYDLLKEAIKIIYCRKYFILELLELEIKLNTILRANELPLIHEAYRKFSAQVSQNSCAAFRENYHKLLKELEKTTEQYCKGEHTFGGRFFGGQTVDADKVTLLTTLKKCTTTEAECCVDDSALPGMIVFAIISAWDKEIFNSTIAYSKNISLGSLPGILRQFRQNCMQHLQRLNESCDVELLEKLKSHAVVMGQLTAAPTERPSNISLAP